MYEDTGIVVVSSFNKGCLTMSRIKKTIAEHLNKTYLLTAFQGT